MAADPLDALRLTLMQDVLPVGLAVVDRVRKGGAREVMAAFDGTSPDPLGQLRQEGEPTASQWRDNLDRVQPGLGNPVMKVEVRTVEPDPPLDPAPPVDREAERGDLNSALARIGERLERLEALLEPPPAP